MVAYWETLTIYKKFQFIGSFKAIEYFVTIVGPHFQWLEFHIKIHCMAGKQCVLSAQKAGKGHFFSEALAGMSTLTERTPCLMYMKLWSTRHCMLKLAIVSMQRYSV